MTTTDDETTEASPTRILGIGVGTFLIALFFFIMILVWLVSSPEKGPCKPISRALFTAIFVIVTLLLINADRKSRFEDQSDIEDHDEGITGRIAVTIIMIISSVLAIISVVFFHSTKTYMVSSLDQDPTSLWQQ